MFWKDLKMLVCFQVVSKQPSLFYSSCSEVALGGGASHCGVRQGVSWQCISCAVKTQHAPVRWMPAKTQGRHLP